MSAVDDDGDDDASRYPKPVKTKQVDELRDAYTEVMSTKYGRRVLFDILDRLGLNVPPIGADPYKTAMLIGPHCKAMELRDYLAGLSLHNLHTLEKENQR